jgi:hypothetical protein
MTEIEKRVGLDDIEADGMVSLEIPDTVYISKKGKMYYPTWCKRATIEISLEEAHKRGYKPSDAYQQFAEQLYNQYQSEIIDN